MTGLWCNQNGYFGDLERHKDRELGAALETHEGVVSISALLHLRADETEMRARWRSLRPSLRPSIG